MKILIIFRSFKGSRDQGLNNRKSRLVNNELFFFLFLLLLLHAVSIRKNIAFCIFSGYLYSYFGLHHNLLLYVLISFLYAILFCLLFLHSLLCCPKSTL